MKGKVLEFILMMAIGVLLVPGAYAETTAPLLSSWDFNVYIDGKKVGKHRFELSDEGGSKRLQSVANFKYKFLFITAYSLPKCVMIFAYWNPVFLDEQRLLNPQTGEFVDVSVEKVGGESLQVRGSSVTATWFELTASNMDVTLWYSADNEWLALESVAKGGHIIRSELS